MSGYILCQVKRAKLPYYIENISTNIYSIEELCFYFYISAGQYDPERGIVFLDPGSAGIEEIGRKSV